MQIRAVSKPGCCAVEALSAGFQALSSKKLLRLSRALPDDQSHVTPILRLNRVAPLTLFNLRLVIL